MNGNPASLSNVLESLDVSQSVLIVDADNVLLHFVKRLEQFLPTKGYELRLESFQLQGNIYCQTTSTAVNHDIVKRLLANFFDECVDDIEPVEGAASALSRLSEKYQIIVLSNVPEQRRARRQSSLHSLGMEYPVIANEGTKGPVVKTIAEAMPGQQVTFIDDLPHHHTSVSKHSPDTCRIHCVADPRLAGFLPPAQDAHQRLDHWPDIEKYLLKSAEY